MKSIGVFCGSSKGTLPAYEEAAIVLADLLAGEGIELVYGAGNIGLMGIMADRMLEQGGRVTGVIPDFLVRREVVHTSLSELIVVETMHERKARMAELSDAFIVMPGGFGTLDELFEILTWNQLTLTQTPIGMLNVAGYYDPMMAMLERMQADRFVRKEHHGMLLCEREPAKLLEALRTFRFTPVDGKWIEDLRMTNRY